LDEDPFLMLRLALLAADRLVNLLPGAAARSLADLAGDAWHRFSPARRRLVTANLARVSAASGRPAGGAELAGLVRRAFRHHARYYVELLRAPRYRSDEIDRVVSVPDWTTYEPALRGHPSILVSWHLGNFEPFGTFLAARGLRPLAPMEVIEPRALFDFIAARRGAGAIELVPLGEARGPITRRLRANGMVAIIGDRDLAGSGQPVTVFGHATTFPTGPATLALLHDATVLAGRCLRTGPDRFEAIGHVMRVTPSGDRRADVSAFTEQLARRFEADVAEAPEQWWGAFQPFWPDIDPRVASDR
jgi:KDO2-lipid IV(A) lauroyltransferase